MPTVEKIISIKVRLATDDLEHFSCEDLIAAAYGMTSTDDFVQVVAGNIDLDDITELWPNQQYITAALKNVMRNAADAGKAEAIVEEMYNNFDFIYILIGLLKLNDPLWQKFHKAVCGDCRPSHSAADGAKKDAMDITRDMI